MPRELISREHRSRLSRNVRVVPWSIVRAVYVVGFLVGTTTHAIDLLAGGYSTMPLPLAVFFTALVVIDPLTAVLVALNWPRLPAALLHPTWLLLNLFSLFVLATWLPLRRKTAAR